MLTLHQTAPILASDVLGGDGSSPTSHSRTVGALLSSGSHEERIRNAEVVSGHLTCWRSCQAVTLPFVLTVFYGRRRAQKALFSRDHVELRLAFYFLTDMPSGFRAHAPTSR